MPGGGITSIRDYTKTDSSDWDSRWCRTDFSLVSVPWLGYHITDSEVILASEVDNLITMLGKLLSGQLKEKCGVSLIEPDFSFILYPGDPNTWKDSFPDIAMDWRVSFWEEGAITENYLSVTLDRDEVDCLYHYLLYTAGRLAAEDPAIRRMRKDGLLVP